MIKRTKLGRKTWQRRDRTINRIRLYEPRRGKIQASVGTGKKRRILEEFITWQAAEAWAKGTLDFTTIGKPTY